MSVRRRGNSLQARLMIDGRTHSESFATRQAAEQWEITGARAIQGTLPQVPSTIDDIEAQLVGVP